MSMSETNAAEWNGERRSDGLAVVAGGDAWIIMPRDDREPIDACPCCGAPMRTARAARLIADAVYPLAPF